MAEPVRFTALYNGVLLQNNQEIYGPTGQASLPSRIDPGNTRGRPAPGG